jgi:hypothetical protein
MKRLLACLALWLPAAALASPWAFSEPLTVNDGTADRYFHHLDGAGRRHVAASAAAVAVAWEDDRSGAPQVYAAAKPHAANDFSRQWRLSNGAEAYEPAIVALAEDRWLAAWEQDGAVVARLIEAGIPGPLLPLAPAPSRQVTLAVDPAGRVAAAWVREQAAGQLVEAAELQITEEAARPVAVAPVAPFDGHAYQGYPALAWGPAGRLVVAWEDRRAGHTRLFHSWREGGGAFAAARQLNEHNAPRGPGGEDLNLGSGVMRVALAGGADGELHAVWLDKRNPSSGYAVWGAASADGGRTFGPNRIVQDELGAAVPQWHAALAAGPAGFVAAWDDTREAWGDSAEPGDVLLSWHHGDGWSADLLVPGASGEGYQGSPAVALDPGGALHLVFIERADLSSPTRLRYLYGAAGAP